MDKQTNIVSPTCRRRLITQGYHGYSDKELNDYKYGIRFAYILCATLFTIGLILPNLTVLKIMAVIAFLGAFPPYHPFDYLYNYGIRHLINKPKMPPRTNQGRFACGMASVWLTAIIYFLSNNYIIAGNILGAILLIIALLVSTLDICIPSMIYNIFFNGKKQKKGN